MRRAGERVRRVPLGAVRQVPGPQGGEGRGVRLANRKRCRLALCPPHFLHRDGVLANQNTANENTLMTCERLARCGLGKHTLEKRR